jgi:sporulation protein YabP
MENRPGQIQHMGAHSITLSGRSAGSITGVKDVLSFDEREILLETEQGRLMIKGRKLHISRLTLEQGEADLEGTVDSFTYTKGSERVKKEPLLRKVFP